MDRHLLAVVLLVAGCAPPKLATSESAVRGGVDDPGDPAVAALVTTSEHCTATLIAPHTVLTAGHCNIIGLTANFGLNASSPSQKIAIAAVSVHPMFTGSGKPYDFALMKLASDPIAITPVRLNDTPLSTADVGQVMRHVGFGVTDDSSGVGRGTKRTVEYPLNRVDSILIYSGAPGKQTCGGDSGGPGFMALQMTELLVGIVSDGPNCNLSQDGWDDRVDMVKDWIVQTVSGWDAPPSFGPGPQPVRDAGVLPGDSGDGDASTGGPPAGGGCAAGGTTASWPIFVVTSMLLCAFSRRARRGVLWCSEVRPDGLGQRRRLDVTFRESADRDGLATAHPDDSRAPRRRLPDERDRVRSDRATSAAPRDRRRSAQV